MDRILRSFTLARMSFSNVLWAFLKSRKSGREGNTMVIYKAYEAMLILKPNLAKDETEKLLDKFQATVKEQGGQITKVDRMGKRKIAYEMKKLTEGFYCLMQFDAPPTAIAEVERQFRLAEDVVTFQILKAAPGSKLKLTPVQPVVSE